MARYILDTDGLKEYMTKIPVEHRGEFLRTAVTALHQGLANYPWAVRIKAKKNEDSIYTEAFETFWEQYPKKTGKGGAFKSWKKTKMAEDVLLRKCLEALKWQKQLEQWTKDKGSFVPNPKTYLDNFYYDDDMPAGMNPDRVRQTITTMDGREIEV